MMLPLWPFVLVIAGHLLYVGIVEFLYVLLSLLSQNYVISLLLMLTLRDFGQLQIILS